ERALSRILTRLLCFAKQWRWEAACSIRCSTEFVPASAKQRWQLRWNSKPGRLARKVCHLKRLLPRGHVLHSPMAAPRRLLFPGAGSWYATSVLYSLVIVLI